MTVSIECVDLAWVDHETDNADDHCAHSPVRFVANGLEFVSPKDGSWTVSAAGLFLLRTLERDHTAQASVSDGNFLFPCCGFNLYKLSGKHAVGISGCPNGVDVWVSNRGEEVTLHSERGRTVVAKLAWQNAVSEFVDSVEDFYRQCSKKNRIHDSELAVAWELFWKEWQQRRCAVMSDQ